MLFIFSSEDSLYPGIAEELYREYKKFRETVDKCAESLFVHLGVDLRETIFTQGTYKKGTGENSWETMYTQPSLFVIEYALSELFISLGIHPEAMIGHGIGEYVAACVSNVLSLEDSLYIVAMRSKLMQKIHSSSMEPILGEFDHFLKKVSFEEPEIPYISTLTGKWILKEEATDRTYWIKHLKETVKLSDEIVTSLTGGDRILLEVGAGNTLCTLLGQKAGQDPFDDLIFSLPKYNESKSSSVTFRESLGKLWLKGVPIDWKNFYAGGSLKRTSLPTYPFERKRYWIEPEDEKTEEARKKLEMKKEISIHDSLNKVENIENVIISIWRKTLGVKNIGLHENFFELGGDSLHIVQIHNKLKGMLEEDLRIVDLFNNPTVYSLSKFIECRLKTKPLDHTSQSAGAHRIKAIQNQYNIRRSIRKNEG